MCFCTSWKTDEASACWSHFFTRVIGFAYVAKCVRSHRQVSTGIRRLQIYFARARRPAATLMLLSGLNNSEIIIQHRNWLHHLGRNASAWKQ